MIKQFRFLALFGVGLSLVACSGGEAAPVQETATTESHAPATSAEVAAPAEATANGNVIEVKMITEGAKNYFEPAEITAKPGDVIRFTLVSGLHNVSFPANKNANAAGLPQPSTFLQQAGQTYDVEVDFSPGTYTFQCDPHVAMGMVGTLTVQ